MSTSYYYVREPFARVEIKSDDEFDFVKVFNEDTYAGALIVKRGLGKQVALMFADKDVGDFEVPIVTHWGGDEKGCVVREQVRGLDPDLTLISEYGEPITVREIRAMAWQGKRKEGAQ